MIEVVIDSIRISLVSQHRIVILKEVDGERQLPIWIGPCEADAITIELQDVKVARPLTQDLLKTVIQDLGGRVSHILVKELNDSVYHASLFIDAKGEMLDIDCRPSDAIALAVRTKSPIFIDASVMDSAAIEPEPDIQDPEPERDKEGSGGTPTSGEAEKLDAFRDFVDTLEFDEDEE